MGIYFHIREFILCFTLLFLFFSQSFASWGKYPIQNFTPSQYKAGIQNIDFAQNRDMTIFVANNLGVLSYNGSDWKIRAFKQGKKQRSLAFDESTNRLYVGSQGEFGFFEDNWSYVSLVEKLPSSSRDFDEVWDVFLLNSKVYFCTFQAIYIYDGESIVVIKQEEGFNHSFLSNGKIFTQNPKGELFEIKNETIIPINNINEDQRIISGVFPQDNGYLLFYNSGEIELSTPFGKSSKYNNLSKLLKDTYVNHVLPLSDARLAISTQTAGIFLYDLQKESIEQITRQDGLQSNACLRTFQDFSGNLWVGMQNGIAFIDINAPMRFINQEIDLQGSGYEVFERAEGTYYTTSNGIYFLAKNTQKSIFLTETEGPAYGMQEIMGKLYAGHHTGLFLLENGNARRIANTDGLWQVKQLRANPKFVVGGMYSGLFLFKINEALELEAVQKIEGFEESSRFFEEDHLGRIWVGQYYKGLYKLELNQLFTSAEVHKISGDSNINIEEQIILSSIDDDLYLATSIGIYKLDRATDQIVKADIFSESIGNQPVYLLTQDNQKNIHIIAKDLVGFFKQISANNYVFIPSSLYQLRYYFNNDLLNVSVNTNDGVYFNANDGFIHYKPILEKNVAKAPPIIVNNIFSVTEDSLLYFKQPFESRSKQTEELLLSQRSKIINIKVESFQFSKVNSPQFRYYLKGLDDNFGIWTSSSSKEYTNLKEGDYEFIVEAKNNLGNPISSQAFLIKVQPPFYRSAWAKIGYGLGAILALIGISKYQKRRYRRKAQNIEAAKNLQISRKEQELLAIEQQKEQELSLLKEEKMRSELQLVKRQLAASTMNLVVKNEFIETIKEELKAVKEKGRSLDMRKSLERVVKDIDSTLRLQEDWEQFEYHFEQVHGDFLSRLTKEFNDLSPNEQKLCTFLRLNLNTKDIANLMGISLRGVEVARYRLRKKLNLQKGQNLAKFILEY